MTVINLIMTKYVLWTWLFCLYEGKIKLQGLKKELGMYL